MITSFLYRLFLRLFARRLVRSAYTGLLGRAPDETGLKAYSEALRARRDLGWLLSEIASSEEALTVAQSRRPHDGLRKPSTREAEYVVSAAFHALLHRPADPEAMAAYTHLLVETGDLTQFLAEIGNSEEHHGLLVQVSRRARAIPR
jgi:hypothetical protein